MEFFTNDVMRNPLASSLRRLNSHHMAFRGAGRGRGSRAGQCIEWLTIADQKQAVIDDVERAQSPFGSIRHSSLRVLFDVHSGTLIEVSEATAVGKAA